MLIFRLSCSTKIHHWSAYECASSLHINDAIAALEDELGVILVTILQQ
ncbi:hypothetical protein F7734_20165 [Scytonema sp. UIC 10036]|nr:hypothetical protein [Scytonema sp. UIC 10036]MUG94564.1 hypothetical protein [Scytonema sp. UIC 10036]